MADEHDLVITRTIEAPLEKVWQAWTDPDKLKGWWGPRGVTNPTCVWEARPGGAINVVMLAGPELGPMSGQEWPMRGQFKEVEAGKKLVYTAAAFINGQEVMQQLSTVTFSEEDGKTKLTLIVDVTSQTAAAEGPLAGMEMGWNQSLDKLGESLTG